MAATRSTKLSWMTPTRAAPRSAYRSAARGRRPPPCPRRGCRSARRRRPSGPGRRVRTGPGGGAASRAPSTPPARLGIWATTASGRPPVRGGASRPCARIDASNRARRTAVCRGGTVCRAGARAPRPRCSSVRHTPRYAGSSAPGRVVRHARPARASRPPALRPVLGDLRGVRADARRAPARSWWRPAAAVVRGRRSSGMDRPLPRRSPACPGTNPNRSPMHPHIRSASRPHVCDWIGAIGGARAVHGMFVRLGGIRMSTHGRLRAGGLRPVPRRAPQHPAARPQPVRLPGRRGRLRRDGRARPRAGRPVVPLVERLEIVRSIRFVDAAFVETVPDKLETWQQVRFDVLFKGDDWRGTPKGDRLERDFAAVGVEVVYFPYTVHTSSTQLRRALDALDSSTAPVRHGRGADSSRNHLSRNAPRNSACDHDEHRVAAAEDLPVARAAGTPGRRRRSRRAAAPRRAAGTAGRPAAPGAPRGGLRLAASRCSSPPKKMSTAANWKPSGSSSQRVAEAVRRSGRTRSARRRAAR